MSDQNRRHASFTTASLARAARLAGSTTIATRLDSIFPLVTLEPTPAYGRTEQPRQIGATSPPSERQR